MKLMKSFPKLLNYVATHQKYANLVRLLLNTWPPLRKQGIQVTNINKSLTRMDVQLKSKWFNQSAAFAIFGGSLYTMTEPFYMLLFLGHIGNDHIVWDKSGLITFTSPARKTINVTFEITPAQIKDIVERCEDGAPILKTFNVDLIDTSGKLVAQVEKVVYIRKKQGKISSDQK